MNQRLYGSEVDDEGGRSVLERLEARTVAKYRVCTNDWVLLYDKTGHQSKVDDMNLESNGEAQGHIDVGAPNKHLESNGEAQVPVRAHHVEAG